jgi:7-carboxy-7-deazaguanine synthase
LRICEIFASVQGEGLDMGLPTVFVRTQGCNLRCGWCDTKYAYEGGSEWSLDTLEDRIRSFKLRRVCLTGGEPMLQKDAPELVGRLLKAGYDVSVETNGSLPVKELPALDRAGRLRISLDIKCPSSKMHRKMHFENLALLRDRDQAKFVLRDMKDYAHARAVLKDHPTKAQVIFQPVWGKSGARIAEAVLRDGLDVRVLIQLHKVLWGARTRGR